jgi:hypothetical protein
VIGNGTALGVFGVWLVWTMAELWLEVPLWAWRAALIVLGIGVQLLIDPSDWWLGVGIGGLALFVGLVADLILVLTDWVRLLVLRRTR